MSLIQFSNDAMKVTRDGDNGIVEALGIRFSDETERDLEGDYFTAETYYGAVGKHVATLNHRIPMITSSTKESDIPHLVNASKRTFANFIEAEVIDLGVVARHVLDLRDEYEEMVFNFAKAGKLFWSSGTASHMMERDDNGEIKAWPILEFAYTPSPAESRLPAITPMKTWEQQFNEPIDDTLEVDTTKSDATTDNFTNIQVITNEENKMSEQESQQNFEALLNVVNGQSTEIGELTQAVKGLMDIYESEIKTRGGFAGTEEEQVEELKLFDWCYSAYKQDGAAIMKHYDGVKDLTVVTGSEGGYLLPPTYEGFVMEPAEMEIIRPLADTQNVESGQETYYTALDQTAAPPTGGSAMFGGVVMKWATDAASKNETDPAFLQRKIVAQELSGYTEMSNFLMRQSPTSIENLVTNLYRGAIGWALDYYALNGDGAGKMLGVLDGNNANKITETRTTASRIKYDDIVNMLASVYRGGANGSLAFLVQQTTALPQLFRLEDSGGTIVEGVFQPNINANNGLVGSLFGVPVYATEKMPATLGTTGDILLANWNEYAIRTFGGVEIAFSPHFKFQNALTASRVILKANGQPKQDAVYTLADGTETTSGFVVLS